ncbi:MAG: molybdopterin-guanine dinucleotide biosynthesis protein B [Rhodospirillales bacterium]|nr:molybdopterin-guanine dinucleotide biosynthesis protein B [Rhodospirillales bacterium]
MRIMGVAGYSGSGKTTLIIRLVPLLKARGLSVSTIKQAHPDFDMDKPGKDSHRHREAGAREVLVTSARRWALLHELEGEPVMDDLVGRLSPVDIVIVEGFRTWPHPRIEVHRPALGKPLLQPEDPNVVAVASDAALTGLPVPVLPLDDAAALCEFVLSHCRLEASA